MSHCKACDVEFKDVRTIDGGYRELCPKCTKVSRREAAFDFPQYLADKPKPPSGASVRTVEGCWQQAIATHRWPEGLGLGRITEAQRIDHLEGLAKARYLDAISLGASLDHAVSRALGKARFYTGEYLDPPEGLTPPLPLSD